MKKLIFFLLLLVVIASTVIFVKNRTQKVSMMPAGSKDSPAESLWKGRSDTSPTPIPPPGVFMISLDKQTVRVGETVTLTIRFDANGKEIVGADGILKYDKTSLRAVKVTPSDFFQTYPRQEIDETEGKITVTGYRIDQGEPLNSPKDFFTVTFEAVGQGSSDLYFDFVPGSTNKSTLVEAKTSKNILGKTISATVKVTQ